MRRLIFASCLGLGLTSAAMPQDGAYYVVPPQRSATVGVFAGPAFGYYPGAYNGFWSNGYSLYGPPVPTYGSIPGYFGGADQRLSNFPSLNSGYFPGAVNGGYVPLNPQKQYLIQVPPARCEIKLPTTDAELAVNGQPLPAGGIIRRFRATVAPGQAFTAVLEARWADDTGAGAGVRTVIMRPGERVVADFTCADG